MERFQAKTVQEILKIPKSRYDYILSKIGIEPDVQKVTGTGNVNIYSFGGLLEIAIASTGIDIGMIPGALRFALDRIRSDDNSENWRFFVLRDTTMKLYYHHGFCADGTFFCYSGDVGDAFLRQQLYHGNQIIVKKPKNKIIPFAYQSIALSEIKKNVISKI